MNAWAVRGWLSFAGLLALAYAGWTSYRVGHFADHPEDEPALQAATLHEADGPIADFRLTDQTGQPFGTAELRERVWVASFFFASCPGTCKQLNLSLSAIARRVPADVHFVSVTCDPDIDTPETLARYARLFDADPRQWTFLTGKMSDLQRVGRDIFQVALEKQTHTEKAFVVDRSGRVRGRFNVLDPDQTKKLIELVKELDAPSDGAAEANPQDEPAIGAAPLDEQAQPQPAEAPPGADKNSTEQP